MHSSHETTTQHSEYALLFGAVFLVLQKDRSFFSPPNAITMPSQARQDKVVSLLIHRIQRIVVCCLHEEKQGFFYMNLCSFCASHACCYYIEIQASMVMNLNVMCSVLDTW